MYRLIFLRFSIVDLNFIQQSYKYVLFSEPFTKHKSTRLLCTRYSTSYCRRFTSEVLQMLRYTMRKRSPWIPSRYATIIIPCVHHAFQNCKFHICETPSIVSVCIVTCGRSYTIKQMLFQTSFRQIHNERSKSEFVFHQRCY